MIIDEILQDYIMRHTSAEDPVLQDLYRETNLKVLYPRMISGHYQGKFIEMISRMIQPLRILEIGTFTGYSAICLAKGLQKNGMLHTIEINDELNDLVLRYFAKAGMLDKVKLFNGDALDIIPDLKEVYDLIFIDADKRYYVEYYDLSFPKLKTGGYLIVDNVLWDGKVARITKPDKDTAGIVRFNEYVKQDKRVEMIMLPLRDGLTVIRKVCD
jgi:caffeoyl-CoA O-methyltransferase